MTEILENIINTVLEKADLAVERVARGHLSGMLGWLFLVPAGVVLAVFGVAPMLYAVFLSLFDSGPNGGRFVGVANYAEALGGSDFWDSFMVTIYYAVGTLVPSLALSFLIANALFRVERFRNVLRTFYFLPYVTSIVAAGMIWRVLFEPREGVANLLLESVGLPGQTWLLEPRGILHIVSNGAIAADAGPSLALCCVILFEVWRSTGFMVVVFLAGLASIPRELEDAARIDGAGSLRVTTGITLPMLSPTIFFLSVVGVIGSFQAFSGIYALTGNGRGPLDTTQNLTVYIFANFYEYGRMEYGAAVAVLLALAIMGLTAIQWRVIGSRVHYD